jgi:hypothetical protein
MLTKTSNKNFKEVQDPLLLKFAWHLIIKPGKRAKSNWPGIKAIKRSWF